MILNPCPILQNLKVISSFLCSNFSNGIVSQGMAIALSRQFENLRSILEYFNNVNNASFQQEHPIEFIRFNSVSANETYNKILNVFNSDAQSQTSIYLKGND